MMLRQLIKNLVAWAGRKAHFIHSSSCVLPRLSAGVIPRERLEQLFGGVMSSNGHDTGKTETVIETGADALVDLLIQCWGVRHVFGYPGDGINGVIEALRRRRDAIQFVQVRHEEAAAFAATGYAKFTGRLGVCLATSGPGAIHLLNGLYDAKADQAPMLAITGLQCSDVIGTHFQQDCDTV
jgi:hypothetical protein